LVAALLLFAQTWLAAHELGHLLHPDDEPCATCVLATGLGAPLPASPQAIRSDAAATPADTTAPIDPIVTRPHHRQLPRGPPTEPR
jgi:hypothetical protein